MNLIEAADELEFVPKDQLAGFVNDPNSRYPSYLVLSEIQRRTQLEKAYNAEQAAMQPDTTIADEVVANFTGQGLASAMPQSSMPQPEMPQAGLQMGASPLPQENVMPSGIQGMAEGGITGYQAGKLLTFEDANVEELNESGLGRINTAEMINEARLIKESDLYPKLNVEYDSTATDASKEALLEDYARYEEDIKTSREIPDEIKNFGLSQVDFSAPTKEERQRDLNVSALAGMAKIFGSATNLGEAGAGLGALATDIQGIRKAARKEDRDLQMQQRTASAQDFEIAAKKDTIQAQRNKVVQDNRKEMTGINKAIAEIALTTSKAEYDNGFKQFEAETKLVGDALKTVTDGMRDQVLLKQVAASENRSLVQLVTELVREKSNLSISNSLEKPRVDQINNELSAINKLLYKKMGVQVTPMSGASFQQTN